VLGWLPLVPYTTDDQVAAEYVKNVPDVTPGTSDYDFEPNAEAILDEIVPRFTELQLYQAMLESLASEHSARMVAMRSASDNATSLVDDLTLVYNKVRQTAITSEILDIVGGAEALQATIEASAGKILEAAADKPVVTKSKPNGGGAKASDDLTRIEGIGPKMSAALKAAGITTFSRLAQATNEELESAIKAAGMRLAPSLGTWAEQAGYAAAGDWDGLAALQDRLVAGRKA
jgi:predicted flap endonuclease-1-like 5' DNA nuclease